MSDLEYGTDTIGICIFGYHVIGALTGTDIRGGAELQMAMLARMLSSHGMAVTVIDPTNPADAEPYPGVFVKGFPCWGRGVRGLRFFTHRLPRILGELRRTHADVFYVRGFSFLYLLPLLIARSRRVPFVLATAHDSDLTGFRERYRIFYRRNATVWEWISTIIPDELACTALLRSADVVLVQHGHQLELAVRRGLRAVRLGNIVDDGIFNTGNNGGRGRSVVVIGAISARKNLRVLLPVVRRLREVTFKFIGDPEGREGHFVAGELRKYPNVVLCGSLDRERTLREMAGAKALLNTSKMEGFPNTFLEAWSLGTPVISLFFDPAGLLATRGLGFFCGGSIERMEDLLRRDHYDIDTGLGREYVRVHHGGSAAAEVFRTVIRGEVQ